jgi:hypothetical protein
MEGRMNLLDQILISIITAGITAILAYFGFWRQAKAELMKEYQSRFNERKWNTYFKIIQSISIINEIKVLTLEEKFFKTTINAPDPQKIEELKIKNGELGSQLWDEVLLTGSQDVIMAYMDWEIEQAGKSSVDDNVLDRQLKLLNCMRVDLGMEKSTLNVDKIYGRIKNKFI